MNGKKILIAYNAPEREQRGRDIDFISEVDVLSQVNAVRSALHELDYEAVAVPLQRSVPAFIERLTRFKPEAIFNLVEGWRGESRYHQNLPSLYELLGFSYTGGATSALVMSGDKWTTKMLLDQAHLPVPRGMLCSEVPGRCRLRYPVIVKPANEDASLGIDFDSVVHNLNDLRRRVAWVIQNYHQPAIVEEYIDGRELNVAILGDRLPVALPISEITFPMVPEGQPRICSYNVKWMESSPEYHWVGAECPALLDEEITLRAQKLAIAAFRHLGCRDYVRVDLRLAPNNQPYIVEVNCNPDLSPDAGFARSVMASGRSYTQAIGEIVACALQRGEAHAYSRPATRRPAAHREHIASDQPVLAG